MKSKIVIENMEVYAFHGCYAEEQIVGNRFLVSVSYTCRVKEATESDNINDTVSYLDIYRLVREEMAVTSHIIEHVAKRIIDRLLREYKLVDEIEVTISKCNPPLGGLVDKVSVVMNCAR